jgi:hypothetical protein
MQYLLCALLLAGVLAADPKYIDCGMNAPQFKVKFKGQDVFSNAAVTAKPQYSKFFRGLTPAEEHTMYDRQFRWWRIAWATILARAFLGLPLWLFYPLMTYCCMQHIVHAHDNNHRHVNPLPFLNRLTGYGMFCSGFLPVAVTFGDIAFQHRLHHKTKCQIDIAEEDNDSWRGNLPWYLWLPVNLLQPSFISFCEPFSYLFRNPAYFWPERIAANLCHWAQLAMLYHLLPNEFWFTLLAGHVGAAAIMGYFNGLLHQPTWLKMLIDPVADPSGMRHGNAFFHIQEIVLGTLLPSAWLECKYHDLHHSYINTSIGACFIKGMTYNEIDEVCAEICDEGLFVDTSGRPVSPLEDLGHKPGSRKKWLESHAKKAK